MMLADNDL